MEHLDNSGGNDFPPPEIIARKIRSGYTTFFGTPVVCVAAAVFFAVGKEWMYSASFGQFLPHAGAQAAAPGAAVPFITYEAEAPTNRLRGTRVAMSGLPRGDNSTPEMEASGRAFAQLSTTGDFIEIKSTRAANALVIRHCIPDAPGGGGTEAMLSLYVNGKKRQSLALSSRHAWLYGEKGQNGQSNDPAAGQAHVFWDEARFFITGGLKAGDALRLQKDGTDSAAFYRVDLVDLEAVPPVLPMPPASTCLSVAAFGANGSDQKDDTEAIQKCIDAAKIQRKIVWMPAGTYFQSEKFALDGVAVQGAGMWRTTLIGTVAGTDWGGKAGFDLRGEGPAVRDLFIDSPISNSRDSGPNAKPLTGSPSKFRIERVWVTHTNTGIWTNGSDGIIRGCRIRSTYADSINLNNGSRNNLVEQNHMRGGGDDGIALLSEAEFKKPPSQDNTIRFNTVSAIWWGHNCDVAGGNGQVIEDNIFADNARMGCVTLNLPGAFPMLPLTGATFRRNSILRGGGNYAWQKRGAIWIYPGSTAVSNIVFEDNLIRDSIFSAIQFTGGEKQSTIFRNNVIENTGESPIHINSDANGSATFENNTLRGTALGKPAIEDDAKGKLEVIQNANSWQAQGDANKPSD